jgi:ectoine hydroxylase-related dioxygenase (phytanoyl-CoA dioxygenase family)
MQHNSLEQVTTLIDKIDSDVFNLDVFEKTGVFILRNAIPSHLIEEWQNHWTIFQEEKLSDSRNLFSHNPVSLTEQLPEGLAHIYRTKEFLDVAKIIFGDHVALYNHRFVIKDKHNDNNVFLHQDSCYHVGNLNKCSFFVPLSQANEQNGGMSFYLGTHKYGYLGDAGEIDKTKFKIQWPKVTPSLNPGDFVIMRSSVWHESGKNLAKIDRILADMILQPADDPTGCELLCGEWQTDFWFEKDNPIQYFTNSRVLKNMKYAEEAKSK